MTDAPVTHAAKEQLAMIAYGTWSEQIIEGVLADMRTLERELNVLRQRERDRQSENRIEA